jgi:hypothetical protein
MHKYLLAVSAACLFMSPAIAQNATATGTGVGVSESNSAAGAVAVNRGNGNSSSSLTINNPANTRAVINSRTEVSGTQTLKNVPTAFAPSLAAAGIETCLGSVSGGGSIVGFGGSFGTTIPDPDCAARLDARTLWSMGLKGAAVARLCQREPIRASMPDVCQKYAPIAVPVDYGAPNYGYAPARVAAYPAGNSGPIAVVNGKTGKTGMCDDYDEPGQKCRKWAAAPHRPIVVAKKQAPLPAAKPAELAVVVP